MKLVRKHANPVADFEEYLRICIYEVAQNITDHAKSNSGGVMCCRYIQRKNTIFIGIVDTGDGIYQTLRRAGHSIATSTEAIKRVLAGGTTAGSRQNNQGRGIANLCDAVRQCDGTLALISHDAMATVTAHESKTEFLERPFHGTVVGFSLNAAALEESSDG